MADPNYTRFDRDPEAVAWARATVQKELDRARSFARQAEERGMTDSASRWAFYAGLLSSVFIGGEGCVIAAFDERLPRFVGVIDRARQEAGA